MLRVGIIGSPADCFSFVRVESVSREGRLASEVSDLGYDLLVFLVERVGLSVPCGRSRAA
jgi:hypothetical protein